MCDENCPNLVELAMVTADLGDHRRQILRLTNERNDLQKENEMLKAKLSQFEKNIIKKTITENETPDASDNEFSDVKTETRSSNEILPKPASLVKVAGQQATNEALNLSTPRSTKRERSSSDEDVKTPARKKKSNFVPFKCPQKGCTYRFVNKKLCQEHQMDRKFHKNLTRACERCPLVLAGKEGFKKHRKTHRDNDEQFLEQEDSDKEPKVNGLGKMCKHCKCVYRESYFNAHLQDFH